MADLIGDQLEELKKALAENTKAQQELQEARSKETSSGKKGVMTKEIMELVSKSSGLTSEIGALQSRLTSLTGLPKIMETMAAETKELKRSNETDAVGKKLEKLNSLMSSTSNSQELNNLFKETLAKLEDPSLSDEEKELLNKQIDEIKKGAQSEENRREAAKLAEENNSRLFQMAEGIEGMGNKFDKFSDNFKKGAGLIGALGAIGMLLFSPETLYKIIDSVINFFDAMYKTIKAIVDGDWGTAKDLVMENLGGIGLALGAIAIFFGGSIFRGISAILKTVRTIGSGISKIGKAFASVGKIMSKTFAPVTDKIKSTFTKVGDILRKFGKTFITVGDEASKFSKFGSILKNVFKRIFFPITVIMGIFDAVKGALAGFEEGGIIGGIRGALIGLFDGIIGGAVNMLTGAVAWILDKLGFDKAAEALAAFDITEYFTKFIDGIGNMISGAFDWIRGAFAGIDIVGGLTSMWEAYASAFGSITDIIFKPVDMAINWIMGMFGFETPEEGFSLKSMIADGIEKVKNLFTSMLDFIPSFSDIKEGLLGMMPSWMKKFISDDEPEEADIPEPEGLKRSRARREEAKEDRESIDSETSLQTRESIETETPETVLETRPATERSQRMIRGNDDESVSRISQSTESTPLEPRIEPTTTPGAVLSSTNDMMDKKAEAASQTNMTIIQATGGGGGKSGGNVNSATAITNNISQGISADDFVRRDFVNGF